jgi:hypothetical protein
MGISSSLISESTDEASVQSGTPDIRPVFTAEQSHKKSKLIKNLISGPVSADEHFFTAYMKFGLIEYLLYAMNLAIYSCMDQKELVFVVREFAEYFLLFAGIVLTIGAKNNIIWFLKTWPIFAPIWTVSSELVLVYSDLHARLASSWISTLVSSNMEPLKRGDKGVPTPVSVRVVLKGALITGNLALFTSFMVFGY